MRRDENTDSLSYCESLLKIIQEPLLQSIKCVQCDMLKIMFLFLSKVGVHIADVSHFIRPGNALDQESAKRGTTVYLCEKVNALFIELSCFGRMLLLTFYLEETETYHYLQAEQKGGSLDCT